MTRVNKFTILKTKEKYSVKQKKIKTHLINETKNLFVH